MVKRVLSLILGFGMITAGVAGIATTIVDQRRAAALLELDKAQEKMQVAAAEEQARQEQKRQEIEELEKGIKEEKQRLEEQRRATEQIRRAAEAMVREQKKAATVGTTAPAPPKEKAGVRQSESEKGHAALSKERRKPEGERLSPEGSRRATTDEGPRRDTEDDAIRRITRKAGMEAARYSEPVEYYNRHTRERILAEPLDHGRDSVRVRIRVWKNDRLIKDKVISFSESSSGEPGKVSA